MEWENGEGEENNEAGRRVCPARLLKGGGRCRVRELLIPPTEIATMAGYEWQVLRLVRICCGNWHSTKDIESLSCDEPASADL